MSRPPLALGTWGHVTRRDLGSGRWVATARFRDFDGKTRQVRAHGDTGAHAERRLVERFSGRTTPTLEEVTPNTTLSQLADRWLEEVDQSTRAPSTRARYHDLVRVHVRPGVGELRVREATVPNLDRFIRAVSVSSGAATAKACRVVLTAMVGLAVRHGALNSNVVRDTLPVTAVRKEVVALDASQVGSLRSKIKADKLAVAADLDDIVDVMLGTGCRIGEVLAITWTDVDLGAELPTLTVVGTVVHIDGKPVRQNHGKTAASRRRLILPQFVVDLLLRRQVHASHNEIGLVFPSATGSIRHPHNVHRAWRSARRRLELGDIQLHTFRKTVATVVDRGADERSASRQLGHSDVRVTQDHYIQRTHEAPDLRSVIETFMTESDHGH